MILDASERAQLLAVVTGRRQSLMPVNRTVYNTMLATLWNSARMSNPAERAGAGDRPRAGTDDGRADGTESVEAAVTTWRQTAGGNRSFVVAAVTFRRRSAVSARPERRAA